MYGQTGQVREIGVTENSICLVRFKRRRCYFHIYQEKVHVRHVQKNVFREVVKKNVRTGRKEKTYEWTWETPHTSVGRRL